MRVGGLGDPPSRVEGGVGGEGREGGRQGDGKRGQEAGAELGGDVWGKEGGEGLDWEVWCALPPAIQVLCMRWLLLFICYLFYLPPASRSFA